ncbi:FxLYD domain-containing protein [Bacillus cereus group sp. BfR-BA-01380]|uniref:FxLYD domain-containing protein n=1 Tax=Bacillus cereus group sp. BfR-BA-01380 TaxID=2920324 RepID=UPI001F569748|nr:FxLYD domain-containing protein [Bacillus cereus group sp. BfR-BA-01380]
MIGDLKFENISVNKVNITGQYTNTTDKEIKLYNIEFIAYDEEGNVLQEQPQTWVIGNTLGGNETESLSATAVYRNQNIAEYTVKVSYKFQ